jgi:hypothetical protein
MVDDLLQSLPLLAFVVLASKVDLVVGELVTTVSSDQTLGVDKVETVASFLLGHALTHEELDDLLGNTDTGRTGSEEHGAVVLAGQTGALDSVDHTAENHGAGTLDVVIEAGVRIPIPLECGEGILEVLELDDNTRISSVSKHALSGGIESIIRGERGNEESEGSVRGRKKPGSGPR